MPFSVLHFWEINLLVNVNQEPPLAQAASLCEGFAASRQPCEVGAGGELGVDQSGNCAFTDVHRGPNDWLGFFLNYFKLQYFYF